MSPEQAEGRKLDGRSDIFSFGSMLYEMVTGAKPFGGDSHLSILAKILREDPLPPSQLSPSVSPDLEKTILRCLRKDAARRYQTMADLKVALEDVETDFGAGAKTKVPAAWTSSQRLWALAMVPAVVLAVAVVAWREWRPAPSSDPLLAIPLTTLPGSELYPSLSPDGNHVAFTWNGSKQDNPDIYVQMIGAGSPLRLTTEPRADYNPVWSPDGRSIAFLRAERLPAPSSTPAGTSELWLIPPLGGPERKLGQIRIGIVGSPGFLTWCPDSSCLVVTDATGEGQPDGLFVISLESGEKRQLTRSSPPFLGDSNPTISPDGRALVFRRTPSPSAGELYWLALGPGLTPTGEPRRLTPATLDAAYPTWMPDGKEILFSAGSPRGGGASLWRLAISGEKVPERLPFLGNDGSMPAVSRPQPGRPARLVYVRNFSDTNIWRIEAPLPGAPVSSLPVVAISSTGRDGMSDLSPDGQRVAFQSDRSGELEIWLADPDGSNAIRLTSMSSKVVAVPRWSPDGTLIAFQSNREGQFEIYVIPAAGGSLRRITSHPATDVGSSFSRDGRWIYFSSNRTGDWQVWKVPTSGGDAVQLTAKGGFGAREGINGADLYYTHGPEQPTAIWRLPASGGQPVRLLERVNSSSTFAVVETGIYYIDVHSGQARLLFFDVATGKSTTVARDLGDVVLALSASADGRTILYSRVDSSIQDLVLVENFR